MRSMGDLVTAAGTPSLCCGVAQSKSICRPGQGGCARDEYRCNESTNRQVCQENQNGHDGEFKTWTLDFWDRPRFRAGRRRLGGRTRVGLSAKKVQDDSSVLRQMRDELSEQMCRFELRGGVLFGLREDGERAWSR